MIIEKDVIGLRNNVLKIETLAFTPSDKQLKEAIGS